MIRCGTGNNIYIEKEKTVKRLPFPHGNEKKTKTKKYLSYTYLDKSRLDTSQSDKKVYRTSVDRTAGPELIILPGGT